MNNDIVQNAVDEIIQQENKKLSAEDEAHGSIYSGIDENNIYEIDNMILDEETEWRERAFDSELENTYDIEI